MTSHPIGMPSLAKRHTQRQTYTFWKVLRRVLFGASLTVTLILLTAGCDAGASARLPQRTIAPTNVMKPVVPTFADWRVAYLDEYNALRIVTLDGTTNIAGSFLPGLTSNELVISNAGISPNGHHIAYGTIAVHVIDISTENSAYNVTNAASNAAAYGAYWSPDSTQLALGSGIPGIYIYNIATGATTQIPHVGVSQNQLVGNVIGWLDSGHLAVTLYVKGPVYNDGSTSWPLSIGLGSLDITSGVTRLITTITSPGLGGVRFTLSPDGTQALFSNARMRDNPYTPLLEEITLATGKVTPLTSIPRPLNSYAGLTSIAWQPGTQVVAASTGSAANGDLQTWTLDLKQDRATHIANGQYVEAWAPNNGPIILSTSDATMVNGPKHTISAMQLHATGKPTMTTLTTDAVSFPIIGLVRTA